MGCTYNNQKHFLYQQYCANYRPDPKRSKSPIPRAQHANTTTAPTRQAKSTHFKASVASPRACIHQPTPPILRQAFHTVPHALVLHKQSLDLNLPSGSSFVSLPTVWSTSSHPSRSPSHLRIDDDDPSTKYDDKSECRALIKSREKWKDGESFDTCTGDKGGGRMSG